MKGFFTGLCFSIFGVVVTLLLFELGFRLWRMTPHETWNDRPGSYYTSPLATNFSELPIAKKRPRKHFRISVVGDSFTFGTQMQQFDAFPYRLEQLLSLSTTRGHKVDVLNLGVPGYSSQHEIRSVTHALDLESDLVLLQITLNDPQKTSYRPTGITGKNIFSAVREDQSNSLVPSWWTSGAYILKRLHNTRTHQSYVEYYHDLFSDPESWERFRSAIQEMKAQTTQKNVRFAAVVFPLFGHPLNENYPFQDIHQQVSDFLKSEKIPFLDLFDSFENIPLSRIQVVPGDDFHPNEIGHRIAAEQIFEWLIRENFLPKTSKKILRFTKRLSTKLNDNGPKPYTESEAPI